MLLSRVFQLPTCFRPSWEYAYNATRHAETFISSPEAVINGLGRGTHGPGATGADPQLSEFVAKTSSYRGH